MAPPANRPTPNAGTLLGIGSMLGVCVGLGVFLGVLGDRAFGTSPLLALLGVLIGILVGAAGAYQVIRPYTRTSPVPSDPVQADRAEPDNDVRSDDR
ncbi:MAG TPA: AtpZ/AtpI family protein [Mycobacteriales bacterium]|nr:AtpZ/AtpI family protein [Mycobacteriales bacterium]